MSRKRVAVVATIGATALLGVGLAVPAVAATPGDLGGWCGGTRAADGSAWSGPGARMDAGRGAGGAGGSGTGGRWGAEGTAPRTHTVYPSGELTAQQRDGLVTMVQEETLAHDLYTALADRYDDPLLARIAASEARHVDAVRRLLDTYGLDDPTDGAAPGDLADPTLAAMYDDLLEQGQASVTAAYEVGVAVETDDLARLADASAGVTAPDVAHVYAQLTTASERHLAAFGGDA